MAAKRVADATLNRGQHQPVGGGTALGTLQQPGVGQTLAHSADQPSRRPMRPILHVKDADNLVPR